MRNGYLRVFVCRRCNLVLSVFTILKKVKMCCVTRSWIIQTHFNTNNPVRKEQTLIRCQPLTLAEHRQQAQGYAFLMLKAPTTFIHVDQNLMLELTSTRSTDKSRILLIKNVDKRNETARNGTKRQNVHAFNFGKIVTNMTDNFS